MNKANVPVKFAVVGSGHIGARHVEMIQKNPESELIGIADIDPRKVEKLGLNGIPIFTSLEDLLSSNLAMDVIVIATPNGFHAAQSLLCLERGSHVVIEKPMALTKLDAEKVIYKALDLHRHVFVVMQNRYSPPSVWIKSILEKGLLGDLYLVELNCFWNRDDRYYKKGSWHGSKNLDGGTLFTQFSHFIDIMYWLFGDIKNISGRFDNFNHQNLTEFEDSGVIHFDFVQGGIGSLNYSTSVWELNLESSLTVIGQYGSIKIGGQYMNEVTHCHIKDYRMPELPPTNPGNDYGAYKGSAANHHYVIENVVDVLKGRSVIKTNALEGLKVVEIIERIYSLRP